MSIHIRTTNIILNQIRTLEKKRFKLNRQIQEKMLCWVSISNTGITTAHAIFSHIEISGEMNTSI